jgi:hypothetical protein
LNAQKLSHELTIEESLTITLNLYANNFVKFFIPMLVASLVSGVSSAMLSDYFSSVEFPEVGAGTEAWNLFFSNIVVLLIASLAFFVVALIASAIAEGVCIKNTSNLVEKRATNTGEALTFTVHKLLPLLAASIITGILIGVGLVLLVVPGIIFAIMFSLAIPSIIIENVGVADSLSMSRKLVSNRWLKTFAFFIIIGVIILFVAVIAIFVAGPFGAFGSLAKNMVNSIVTAFAGPVVPIAVTVYYYSMKGRKQQQQVPPPPPPPF